MSDVPQRPTVASSVGTSFRRIRGVEKRRIWPSEWHCVRPVAPAADWSATQTYYVGDVVSLAGNGYRCVTYHLNQAPPDAAYWEPIGDDPYSVEFAGTWANIGGDLEPTAYRFNQGETDLRINATGDETTPDSLIFTITAPQFIPELTKRVIAMVGAGQAEVDLMGAQTADAGKVIFRRLISSLPVAVFSGVMQAGQPFLPGLYNVDPYNNKPRDVFAPIWTKMYDIGMPLSAVHVGPWVLGPYSKDASIIGFGAPGRYVTTASCTWTNGINDPPNENASLCNWSNVGFWEKNGSGVWVSGSLYEAFVLEEDTEPIRALGSYKNDATGALFANAYHQHAVRMTTVVHHRFPTSEIDMGVEFELRNEPGYTDTGSFSCRAVVMKVG